MNRKFKSPSPALVLSIIAIFISLGGGAYAAFGPGSVGTKALRDGAVTNPKLRGKSVTKGKLAERSVTRSKLAAGAVGPKQLESGIPGSVVAYAEVTSTGVEESRSRGITDDNLGTIPPGVFCFYDLPEYGTATAVPLATKDERRPILTMSLNPIKDGLCRTDDERVSLAVITENRTGPDPGYSLEPFNLVLFK